MEERLTRLEQAVAALQAENELLKQELSSLQERQVQWCHKLEALADRLPPDLGTETPEDAATPSGVLKGRLRRRWPLVAMALTIALPLVALSVWHLDAFWSTTLAFLNGFLLYYLGPRAWSLLIEGAFRAIPGVLFGQATRLAIDKFRSRRAKPGPGTTSASGTLKS